MPKIRNFRFCGKILFFSVIIFSLFSVVSCATTGSTAAPEWVTNPYAVYPDSDYLCAVGTGDDRSFAESAAVAALSKIIKQKVSAETTASESYIMQDSGWQEQKAIDGTVKTETDLKISGITIKSVWKSRTECYALALINREEVGRLYKTKASDLADVINAKIAAAYKDPSTFASVRLLKEAAALAAENEENLDILGVVHPDMRRIVSPEYKNAAAVSELARKMLDETRIFVSVDGDVSGRITAAFSDVIQSCGIQLANEPGKSVYTLKATLSITPFEMSNSNNNKYARYVLDAYLLQNNSAKNELSFSLNGREAHVSETEAAQRAVRTVEQEVKKKFTPLFKDLL